MTLRALTTVSRGPRELALDSAARASDTVGARRAESARAVPRVSSQPSRAWVKDAAFISVALSGALLCAMALRGDVSAAGAESTVPAEALAERESAETARAVAGRLDASLELDPAVARAPMLTVARRLSLALTGTIPSIEEIRLLERQRERASEQQALAWWVERLLADRRCADYLAERLARALVGVEQGSLIFYRRRRFVAWLSDQLIARRPYDELVAAMIAGRGLWTQHPEANFVTSAIKPDGAAPEEATLAGRVSRALLGARLDCAECHDHPFDERWTQRDFQGLAAFFGGAGVGYRGVQELRGEYRYDDHASGGVETIAPQVPFARELLPEQGGPRERLAGWVTHPDNGAFARATVNRVWTLMLGRPLVDPVDDIPLTGPHPEALTLLAEHFAKSGFDLHALIRAIAASEAFARESRRAPAADAAFAGRDSWDTFPITRLRPEQVVGALLQAASIETVDRDSHVLLRLARYFEEAEFVRRYGDAGEDELLEDGGTIPQRLLLLNGALVHDRIEQDLVANASTRIAALAPDDARAIELAFLAVLSRRPSAREHEHFRARVGGTRGDARARAVADLYWALLNTTEFAWNH